MRKLDLKNFHFPSNLLRNFGRNISTVYLNGNFWASVQVEKGRKTDVAIYKNGRFLKEIETDGFVHQPSISPIFNRELFVCWNEVKGKKWIVKGCTLNRKIEKIWENNKLILPPDICSFQSKLWCAFPTINGDKIKIHLAEKEAGKWVIKKIFSGNYNSFRCKLSSDKNYLYCIYDRYRNKTYEIVCEIFNGKKWKRTVATPPRGERWLSPKIISSDYGTYAVWVCLKEVEDKKLGIRDHFPFAMVGKITENGIEYLYDRTHPEDKRIVIDLREGLLASEIYQGYHGLRRNPFLSISDKGVLWCFWEVKIEGERTNISGHLFGRKIGKDNQWSVYYDLYNGKYSYSVPSCFEGEKIPVYFVSFEKTGEKIIESDFVSLSGRGKIYKLEVDKWRRWKPVKIKKVKKKRGSIYVKGRKYKIFWADTHCHSVHSPDAEGEIDELINYAKDIAGIDIVCITDNDYYPHKSFTEAEWEIQKQLSKHFSKEGKFIVFCGWEFTYHRQDLNPTYNHRTVIYPFPEGPLYRRIDKETNTDEKLMEKLKDKKVICYPHHCTYKIVDPAIDRNVEVCSSWRVCMEEIDFTILQLKKGKIFGFIGSSDTHRAVPGLGGALTGVVAEKLTRQKLYKAYITRRLLATQGCKLKIDFRVSDLFMGEKGEVKDFPQIMVKIIADKKIDFVEVLRDGEIILRKKGENKVVSFKFKDKKCEKGEHFYFLRVKLTGDPSLHLPKGIKKPRFYSRKSKYPHNLARAAGVYAWTSPVWISFVPKSAVRD